MLGAERGGLVAERAADLRGRRSGVPSARMAAGARPRARRSAARRRRPRCGGQQQREEGALPPTGERVRRGSVRELERTEDPIVHVLAASVRRYQRRRVTASGAAHDPFVTGVTGPIPPRWSVLGSGRIGSAGTPQRSRHAHQVAPRHHHRFRRRGDRYVAGARDARAGRSHVGPAPAGHAREHRREAGAPRQTPAASTRRRCRRPLRGRPECPAIAARADARRRRARSPRRSRRPRRRSRPTSARPTRASRSSRPVVVEIGDPVPGGVRLAHGDHRARRRPRAGRPRRRRRRRRAPAAGPPVGRLSTALGSAAPGRVPGAAACQARTSDRFGGTAQLRHALRLVLEVRAPRGGRASPGQAPPACPSPWRATCRARRPSFSTAPGLATGRNSRLRSASSGASSGQLASAGRGRPAGPSGCPRRRGATRARPASSRRSHALRCLPQLGRGRRPPRPRGAGRGASRARPGRRSRPASPARRSRGSGGRRRWRPVCGPACRSCSGAASRVGAPAFTVAKRHSIGATWWLLQLRHQGIRAGLTRCLSCSCSSFLSSVRRFDSASLVAVATSSSASLGANPCSAASRRTCWPSSAASSSSSRAIRARP